MQQGDETGLNMLRGDATAVSLSFPMCADGIRRFSYKYDNVESITDGATGNGVNRP